MIIGTERLKSTQKNQVIVTALIFALQVIYDLHGFGLQSSLINVNLIKPS